jgi:putative PIN family toxin of toxin-antitoxin system
LHTGVLLTSFAALHELNNVLHRKKFDKYLTIEERESFLEQYTQRATMIDILEEIRSCRDPKDDKFLEIAVNGQATRLITGDPDLLVLHPFRGIAILSPDQLLLLLPQMPSS